MSIITDVRAEIDPEQPDWSDAEPIISEQPATWVYWNPRSQIVIRQRQDGYCQDEEPFLFFSVENVPTLIAALRTKLAEFTGAVEDLPEPRIKAEAARRPLTAAERQRRRRDRSHEKRDGSHEPRDAERDARDIPPGEDPGLFALEEEESR
jgi:hypothetical protein